MKTMNAEEREALKDEAVRLLRAAVGAKMGGAEILRRAQIKDEALGRYLGGVSRPPPRVAARIIAGLKKVIDRG